MCEVLRRSIDKYQRDGLWELTKIAYKYHLKRKVEHELIDPLFDRFVAPTDYSRALSREDLANTTGIKKSLVSEAENRICCSSPLSCGSHPVFENVVGEHISQELHVYEINNAKLVGSKGILIKNNKFLMESVKGVSSYLKNDIKSNPINFVLAANNVNPYSTYKSSGDEFVATSLVGHTGKDNHYGHWIVEYLPMLYGLKKYEESTGVKPVIFINSDPPQWMVDSLFLLGYERERLVEWDSTIVEIDSFILPLTGHISPEWEFAPKSRKWVGKKICKSLPNRNMHNMDRIFISRQGLNKRAVTNLDEIKPILESYNIHIIHPERMEFYEQVDLYRNCELLMGPSGSGLHNLIFANEATILELFHPDHVTSYNYRLAQGLGNEYRFILGSKSNKKEWRPVKDQCFTISPSALRDSLENWLADHKTRT